MFYLYGARSCLKTIMLISSNADELCQDAQTLRSRYLNFCSSIGGQLCTPQTKDSQLCYNEDRIKFLIAKYSDKSSLTDIETDTIDTPISACKAALHEIEIAKSHLRSVDHEFVSLFDFVIHTIFYSRSLHSGGGSVSSSPGVIWCALRKSWTVEDVCEFLVHEFSHNALFLDERAHKHYIDFNAVADRQNYAVSAILKIPRPLDKVFHSIIVAHEVLSYRSIAGAPQIPVIHPSSSTMKDDTLRSIDEVFSVINRTNIVTPRFHKILNDVSESKSLNFSVKQRYAHATPL